MKKYFLEKGTVRQSGIFHYAILAILFCFQVSLFTIEPTEVVPDFVSNNNFSYVGSASAQEETVLQNTVKTEKSYTGKLLFMGDTMLDRGVGAQIEQGINPFEHVKDVLLNHDLRIANIETTIADPSFNSAATKPYTFNAPLKSLEVLKANNIDVSILANNHTGDFGASATSNMIDLFEANQLSYAGIGKDTASAFKPLIKYMVLAAEDGTKSVIKVGFISVNDIELAHTKVSDAKTGGAYFDRTLITNSIQQARADGADIVVVIPHWGIEYQNQQSKNQEEWGRFLIDSGADMVIGGHPHVIQPTEIYKNKPIVYSMGNFIFDGMSGDALRGQMVSVPIKLNVAYDGQNSTRNVAVGESNSIEIQIDSYGLPHLTD
ncbi:MAG: CapA family protein [Candidatus Saccharibacteria bacterium]|nr:CapA family protein [Candidatus Saccharibacteria bacterium]